MLINPMLAVSCHYTHDKVCIFRSPEPYLAFLKVSDIVFILSLQVVLHREEEILSSECDMCILHGLLSKIPDNLPYEQLIRKAGDLFLQYPPDVIEKEAAAVHERRKYV